MNGAVYIARNSQEYPDNPFGVYVPQEDLRYIGNECVRQFKTREEAEVLRAQIAAKNTYVMDAQGWFRRVERCAICEQQFFVNKISPGYTTHSCKWCTDKMLAATERCDGCGLRFPKDQVTSRGVGTEYERHACPTCNALAIEQGLEK